MEGATTKNLTSSLGESITPYIEVMEVKEASKPVILSSPDCFIKHNNHVKRRWRLLKNVRTASRRRSSLTSQEDKFLKSLTTTKSTSDKACAKRATIRNSIISTKLTDSEQHFLTTLMELDDVTDEQLENCKQVLERDPIFTDDELHDDHDDDKEKSSKNRPTAALQHDASFREEVWTHYESLRHIEEVSKIPPPPPPKKKEEKGGTFLKNFFGGGSSKEEEEAKNESEEEEEPSTSGDVRYTILATNGKAEDCKPNVLSPYMMNALRKHMPFVVSEDNFWLKYSMTRDGASMRMLLKHVRSSARTIIAVETFDGDVFGSFTSSPWRPNGRSFYGNGETFLWKLKKSRYTHCDTVEQQVELEKDIEIFQWSGKNYNIQALINPNSNLVLGGGGDEQQNDPTTTASPIDDEGKGSGLILNSDLEGGSSDPCMTFDSPSLSCTEENKKDTMFEIVNVEVWTLTPVESVEQAQQLELGRQFLFDHGNFAKS